MTESATVHQGVRALAFIEGHHKLRGWQRRVRHQGVRALAFIEGTPPATSRRFVPPTHQGVRALAFIEGQRSCWRYADVTVHHHQGVRALAFIEGGQPTPPPDGPPREPPGRSRPGLHRGANGYAGNSARGA